MKVHHRSKYFINVLVGTVAPRGPPSAPCRCENKEPSSVHNTFNQLENPAPARYLFPRV